MKNQIEIVKDIADGMIGIGGIPTNEEFYAEFDMRVRSALCIHDVVGQSEQLKAFAEWVVNDNDRYIGEYTVGAYLESL